MSRPLRFLYLNMNFHIEHHLIPTVPYHRLPELHALIADQLPEPSRSFPAARGEALRAMWRQRSDPDHQIPGRVIPAGSQIATEVAIVVDARPVVREGRRWLDAGPIDRFATESVVRVDDGDATYALYRLADGSLRATDGICTHSRRTHLAGGLVIDG